MAKKQPVAAPPPAVESTDPKRELRVKDHQTGNVTKMTWRAFQGIKEEKITKNGKYIYRYSSGSATPTPVPKAAPVGRQTDEEMGE